MIIFSNSGITPLLADRLSDCSRNYLRTLMGEKWVDPSLNVVVA